MFNKDQAPTPQRPRRKHAGLVLGSAAVLTAGIALGSAVSGSKAANTKPAEALIARDADSTPELPSTNTLFVLKKGVHIRTSPYKPDQADVPGAPSGSSHDNLFKTVGTGEAVMLYDPGEYEKPEGVAGAGEVWLVTQTVKDGKPLRLYIAFSDIQTQQADHQTTSQPEDLVDTYGLTIADAAESNESIVGGYRDVSAAEATKIVQGRDATSLNSTNS